MADVTNRGYDWLQPTLPLLCAWPTETCIVPPVETAHGYNDLIYSVTCVNIFFSSVLPCLSLYFGLFISHYSALPLFSVASITCLSVYFSGVPCSLCDCSQPVAL